MKTAANRKPGLKAQPLFLWPLKNPNSQPEQELPLSKTPTRFSSWYRKLAPTRFWPVCRDPVKTTFTLGFGSPVKAGWWQFEWDHFITWQTISYYIQNWIFDSNPNDYYPSLVMILLRLHFRIEVLYPINRPTIAKLTLTIHQAHTYRLSTQSLLSFDKRYSSQRLFSDRACMQWISCFDKFVMCAGWVWTKFGHTFVLE